MTTQNILNTFAVLRPDLQVDTVELTPSLYADIDTKYNLFKQHNLISAFSFNSNWDVWEMHPAGEEVVMLLSGTCELLLRINDMDKQIVLNKLGDYAVVPKDTWHTARTNTDTQLLFITPGEGTVNQPTPD